MKKTQIPLARKEGLVIQEMPDELLVYDMDANKAHCLNTTASSVWKACDGKNDVVAIAKLLNKTDSAVAEDLVWLAINQLNESNLLEKNVPTKFEGLTRREVIKKVGITAAIALPIISVLSFPNAVLAVACDPSAVGTMGGCINAGELCCAVPAAPPQCTFVGTGTCPP